MAFGGVIGIEREIGNRPAGFRTHTLVCMGSALAMMTSEFLFNKYGALTKMDPARLGAQVISGIGFLGAGTIIKDGSHVRGLTTAASLWVVACIGLAIGAGFYWGALITTVFSYITLDLLKKFINSFNKAAKHIELNIQFNNVTGIISEIINTIKEMNIRIYDFDIKKDEKKDTSVATICLGSITDLDKKVLYTELSLIPDVIAID